MRLYCYKTCAFFLSSEKDLSGENTFILNSNIGNLYTYKADKIDYTSNVTVSGGAGGAQNIIGMSVTISGLALSNLLNKLIIIFTTGEVPYSAMTFGTFKYINGANENLANFTTMCNEFIWGSNNTPTLSNEFSISFIFHSDVTSICNAYSKLSKFLVF